MVEEHSGDMNSRDMKEARRIQAEFAFEDASHGRYGRRDRERDRDRDRDREPPPHQRQPQASTSVVATLAPTRPTPGSNRRREGFGGALTEAGPSTSAQPSSRQQTRPSTPQNNADVDPIVAEYVFFFRTFLNIPEFACRRHANFLARLQQLAPNPTAAVPAVKAATRGYRSSESSARDLILTIWNVLDRNLDYTASIVNMFIDLLEDEEKKQDLLSSWKGFAVEVIFLYFLNSTTFDPEPFTLLATSTVP